MQPKLGCVRQEKAGDRSRKKISGVGDEVRADTPPAPAELSPEPRAAPKHVQKLATAKAAAKSELERDPNRSDNDIAFVAGCEPRIVYRLRVSLGLPRRSRGHKYLASELFNIPAGLVDLLRSNRLNLKEDRHLQAAHKIADAVASQYVPHDLMDEDEVVAMHDAIDRLAENPDPVAVQLDKIEQEMRDRAAHVQAVHWSDHHRQKADCYPVHPIVWEPIHIQGLDPHLRDVIE